MKDLLVDEVEGFILKRWKVFDRPFLLAYSGGPDSKALLYMLLKCQKRYSFKLVLIHVDHGWREESRAEAAEIMREAEGLGLPVYLRRLEEAPTSNMEAWGRKGRMDYFKEVYDQVGAEGIFLAHQADDLAETVLKRLFEGAHFSRWGAISPDAEQEGMRLLRPLLGRSKEELVQWLSRQGEKGFCDPSNNDTRFLRGRMRKELIPLLSTHFGKEIGKNLCRVATASRDIEAYLARRCAPLLDRQRWIERDLHWDLRGEVDPVELRWALKYWTDGSSLKVSREVLESIAASVEILVPYRRFLVGGNAIEIRRGILICFSL